MAYKEIKISGSQDVDAELLLLREQGGGGWVARPRRRAASMVLREAVPDAKRPKARFAFERQEGRLGFAALLAATRHVVILYEHL
jgi:hypothetical protein